VLNYRSGVEYRLSKLVARDDERLKNPIYYPPEASEFSRKEIRYFVSFFVGFLEGYWESWGGEWKDPFLLAVQSNLILFGFDGEEFFSWQFDSSEEFAATRAELAGCLPTPG
jgi:hypothetical protein